MKRKFGLILAFFTFTALFLLSCDDNTVDNSDLEEEEKFEFYDIASWNIQVFGQAKLKDTLAMRVITDVCKSFDIIAIQEIRSKEQNVISTLIDSLGEDYTYVISRRLGRTISKEQYAFVYKKDIEIVDTFQTEDPFDQIHREPFGFRFKLGNKTITLLNIHTHPDEEELESYLLDTLLSKELNGILLGDLNRNPFERDDDYFFENYCSQFSEFEYSNLAGTHSYDNFIYNCDYITVPGSNGPVRFDGGIYNFQDTFNLELEDAKRVSDHFPVYIQVGTFHYFKD